jgi:hypothetical protein
LNSALCCFLFTPTSHVLWTGQPLAYPAVQKSGAAAKDVDAILDYLVSIKGMNYPKSGG